MKALALLALIFGISNANAQTDTCEALNSRLTKLEAAKSKLEPIQSKLFKVKAALYAGDAALAVSLLKFVGNELESFKIGGWGDTSSPLTRKITLTVAALSVADIITAEVYKSKFKSEMNDMIAETAENLDSVEKKESKIRAKLEANNCK